MNREPESELTAIWIKKNCFDLFYTCIRNVNSHREKCVHSPLVVSVSINGMFLPHDPTELKILEETATSLFQTFLLNRDFERHQQVKLALYGLRELPGGVSINVNLEAPQPMPEEKCRACGCRIKG